MTKERVTENNDFAAWLREAVNEVSADVREVKSGRPGFMRTYTVDELLKELHA